MLVWSLFPRVGFLPSCFRHSFGLGPGSGRGCLSFLLLLPFAARDFLNYIAVIVTVVFPAPTIAPGNSTTTGPTRGVLHETVHAVGGVALPLQQTTSE